jgi:hypothetical protein
VRGVAAVALSIALAAGTAAGQATPSGRGEPRVNSPTAARLPIAAVGDSTIILRVREATWLRPNQRGIVVDPRSDDALVARFRLLSVFGDSATALLTGLTTPVERHHVAVVEQPRVVWYRQGLFWMGAAIGTVLGVMAGAAF